jgi:ubiquinone/menaquinone biosynthesis C-methylase UbiE
MAKSKMKTINYVLGHDSNEQTRLDHQAELLKDPSLEAFIAQAKTCLEIGCGVGSNLHWIRKANPSIHYTGVDIGIEAIEAARLRYDQTPMVSFHQMDAHKLDFPSDSYDVVFSKLVLWAVGANWLKVLEECYRVLKPGGTFHSFEPDDELLLFYPDKPAFSEAMRLWDVKALEDGLNPFVGREVHQGLHRAKFQNIGSHLFTKVLTGLDPVGYRGASANLAKLYLGKGPASIGLKKNSTIWRDANREIRLSRTQDLIVESYFVTSGKKSEAP